MVTPTVQEEEVGTLMSTLEREETSTATSTARRRWVGFVGLAVASFLGCIDLTIVTTALPEITRGLDTTVATSQLTLGIFLMALAMFMVAAGRLGDRYGRRRVLLIGLTVFVVASIGAASAGTITALVVARFFQGAATATLYTSTSTLVESLFPEGRRGKAIGLLYAINGVGLAAGPVLGALLVPTFGWAAIFWVNVPLGVLALIGITAAVGESRAVEARGSDWAGQAALTVTVAAGVGVPVLGDIAGWVSVPVVVSAVVFVVGIAATVIVERRAADPLLEFALFTHRTFSAAIVSDFFLAVFYASALLILPLYLTAGEGFGLRASGLLLLLVSATMAVTSPQVGKVVDRAGPHRPLVAGFAFFVVAGVAITTGAFAGWLAAVLVGLVLFGLAWGLTLGPATVAALSSVDESKAGFAVGASWTFHNFGGALGAAVAAGVYGSPAAGDVGDATGRVAIVITGTSVVALVAVALLNRRR